MREITFVHLQPAVVGATVVVILETHVEENDEGRDAPTNEDILLCSEHARILHHTCYQAIHVDCWYENDLNYLIR